jgi:hypothetical protein
MRCFSLKPPSGSFKSWATLHGVRGRFTSILSSRQLSIVKFRGEDANPVPNQSSTDTDKAEKGQLPTVVRPSQQEDAHTTGHSNAAMGYTAQGGNSSSTSQEAIPADRPHVSMLSPSDQLLLQQRIAELQMTDPYTAVNQVWSCSSLTQLPELRPPSNLSMLPTNCCRVCQSLWRT